MPGFEDGVFTALSNSPAVVSNANGQPHLETGTGTQATDRQERYSVGGLVLSQRGAVSEAKRLSCAGSGRCHVLTTCYGSTGRAW